MLPALIRLLNPPGEPEPLGYTALAPVDDFLARHRIAIIVGVVAVVIGGLPLLYWLRFDFNPINLRNPKTESIATYLDLARDPSTNVNAIEVLAPNLDEANAIAANVAKLPEVSHAMTLSSFIPRSAGRKAAADPGRRGQARRRLRSQECARAADGRGERRRAQRRRAAADRGRRRTRRTRAPGPPRAIVSPAPLRARQRDARNARAGRCGFRHAATRGSRGAAGRAAGATVTRDEPAARSRARLDDARRPRARLHRAARRPQRQRRDAPLRGGGARRRARRDRGADHDPGGGPHGGPRLHRGGPAGRCCRSRSCCGWCCGGSATCC